jgi:hypothetical protein
MKLVYSNKYLYWILLIITLVYSGIYVLKLLDAINAPDNLYIVVYSVVSLLLSVFSFSFLLFKHKYANLTTQLFIFACLLLPPIYIIYTVLTDYLFYGVNRLEMMTNFTTSIPLITVQLIIGIILLILTITDKNSDTCK